MAINIYESNANSRFVSVAVVTISVMIRILIVGNRYNYGFFNTTAILCAYIASSSTKCCFN